MTWLRSKTIILQIKTSKSEEKKMLRTFSQWNQANGNIIIWNKFKAFFKFSIYDQFCKCNAFVELILHMFSLCLKDCFCSSYWIHDIRKTE